MQVGGVEFDVTFVNPEADDVMAVMAMIVSKLKVAQKNTGQQKTTFTVVLLPDETSLDGSFMGVDPASGEFTTIYVNVPRSALLMQSQQVNVEAMLEEEIWHLVDGAAIFEEYLNSEKSNADSEHFVYFESYYDQVYLDVYDGMTDSEKRESISTYYDDEGIAEYIATELLSVGEKEKRAVEVAREFVRMRLQQRSKGGKTTESKYANRKIAPALGRLMRMLAAFYEKLSNEIPSFAASSKVAERIVAAENYNKALNKKRQTKKDAARGGGMAKAGKADVGEGGAKDVGLDRLVKAAQKLYSKRGMRVRKGKRGQPVKTRRERSSSAAQIWFEPEDDATRATFAELSLPAMPLGVNGDTVAYEAHIYNSVIMMLDSGAHVSNMEAAMLGAMTDAQKDEAIGYVYSRALHAAKKLYLSKGTLENFSLARVLRGRLVDYVKYLSVPTRELGGNTPGERRRLELLARSTPSTPEQQEKADEARRKLAESLSLIHI